MAITKPTVAEPGWNEQFDDLIDEHNALMSSGGGTPIKGVRCYALTSAMPGGTAQVIPNEGDGTINLTHTEYNDDTSVFTPNLTTNAITVIPGGLVLISWEVTFIGGSGPGERDSYVLKNPGGALVRDDIKRAASNEMVRSSFSGVVRLSAGESVNLNAYVDGGSSATIKADAINETGLTLVRLGA